MNEQKIEDLKNALREVMALISQRNQPIREELKSLLVQVMDHVANRIQELREEEQQPPTKTPELEESPFPSSNISRFKYDPKSQDLYVQFLDKWPNANGPVYHYSGIPQFIYNIFQRGAVGPQTSGGNKWHHWVRGKTPSLGAALNALIKAGGYPYQRLA